nr:M20/M25/M40 family metallo-hydrolase [Paenibacillus sp. NEAU-GSW1]
MEKLEAIAKEPHPVGSLAHDAVRDYLLSELTALGLEPTIQASGKLENIVARMPGTSNSQALMIAAHYDSVAGGPGAADDGAAIAAMLETVRAIQASGPLKNDLILLMTDGEEMGLYGAKAFISNHPWAKEPAIVLNFEARGNKGPSLMFETSEQNGWLVQQLMKAAPQPIAYSLIYNVYKIMPNDTDLTVFKEGGLHGMNFAFGMGVNAYHKMIDTPENLDRGSLQHHGEYMLNLTRHFGNMDLKGQHLKQEDRVYFNVFGWKMASYPVSWAKWFAILAALLFIATLVHGLRQRKLTLKGTAGGFALTLLSLGLVFGAVMLIWGVARSNVPIQQYRRMILDPQISLYALFGFLLLAALIVFLLIRWLSRYARAENIWMGALLLWLVLCAGTTFYLPGGSYLFTWPLLFSLAGLNISLRTNAKKAASTWLSALFAAPGLMMLTPICYLIYMMMTMQMAAAIVTIAAFAFTLIFPIGCAAAFKERKEGLAYREHSHRA